MTNPIAEIADAVRAVADPLIIVDAVSSLGSMPMEMDAWGLDAVLTASQKGWLSPPGIAMAALSERGWAATESSTMPSFYFDLTAHHEYASRGQPPWTPRCRCSTRWTPRCRSWLRRDPRRSTPSTTASPTGRATRCARWASGLSPKSATPPDTVTAVWVPEQIAVGDLSRLLREKHDVVIAAGQGKLATSIFRIGHLGWLQESEMAACYEAIQSALIELGLSPPRGRSSRRCAAP